MRLSVGNVWQLDSRNKNRKGELTSGDIRAHRCARRRRNECDPHPCSPASDTTTLQDRKGAVHMLPTGGDNAGSPGSGSRQRDIEIASTREMARTLSAASDAMRSTDRKKVLERARRMLAMALEEERKDKAKREAIQSPRATEHRPGCGAWWLF